MMTRVELEAVWDDRLVLMTKRAALNRSLASVRLIWFLGAIHKYRRAKCSSPRSSSSSLVPVPVSTAG